MSLGLVHREHYKKKALAKCQSSSRPNLSHPRDLNPKPITYEAIALPIELGWHWLKLYQPEDRQAKLRANLLSVRKDAAAEKLAGGGR